MTDTSKSHYHITLETIFMDVFGIQKYFKSDFYFVVVTLAYPKVLMSELLVFAKEDPNFVFGKDLLAVDEASTRIERLEPYFIGLSDTGALKIRWNYPINKFENLSQLTQRKVLLPLDSSSGSELTAWVTDRTSTEGIHKYIVKDAFEIKLIPWNDEGQVATLISAELE